MVNPSRSLWLFSGLLLLALGCSEAPQYPLEPVITFEGLNKGRVYQFTNGPLDSLIITFSFTDGDGDLSQLGSDSVDIVLTDSRTPQLPIEFRFPLIDEEGTGSGISGTATITIVNTNNLCCIFESRLCADDPDYPVDTFSYDIRIRDRSNNWSNTINTGPIEILCLGQ